MAGTKGIFATSASTCFFLTTSFTLVPALACAASTYPMATFDPGRLGAGQPLVTSPILSPVDALTISVCALAGGPDLEISPTRFRLGFSFSWRRMTSAPGKSLSALRRFPKDQNERLAVGNLIILLPMVHARPASIGVVVSSMSFP